MPEPTPETFYRSLLRIRRVEEEVARVYPTDVIQSPIHLSIGQEAIAVGVCSALGPGDIAVGTYRSHALYLAKGGDLKRMIAELFCRVTGAAKGKGGSMHLVDMAAGLFPTSAVVATGIPHAVGAADQLRYAGQNAIVACFFGDGAVDEGAFHESMNLASLWGAPVLFVCEDNGYAIHATRRDRQVFVIERLARSYEMPVRVVDGNDVFAVYQAAASAVKAMRKNPGPWFFECRTYRWREHVGPKEDFDRGYRSREEAAPWLARDPLSKPRDMIPSDLAAEIEAAVEKEVAEAFRFAAASPPPEPTELLTDLFA